MDIVLRAVVLFLFVWFVTRAVGRRELSTLQPFDLILLVVLGDLIQQGVTQNDFSVTGAILAGGTMAAMTVLFSYAAFRFPRRVGQVLEGDPVILVERGEPLERNLRRNRITMEELAAQARLQQIAHLRDVEWAVLETGGQISFIPKRS
ncbi:MAG TPA: YetF domain-containing protein [Gaiellaceae bacterium]|nr:YetF domain-containing protein [Gaiellaceae bacterium]